MKLIDRLLSALVRKQERQPKELKELSERKRRAGYLELHVTSRDVIFCEDIDGRAFSASFNQEFATRNNIVIDNVRGLGDSKLGAVLVLVREVERFNLLNGGKKLWFSKIDYES